MAELRLTHRARDDLAALPQPLQKAVSDRLARIAIEPDAEGKALLGRLGGLWSARVGSYRVISSIGEANEATVRSIRHRAVAYGRRRDD